MLVKMQWQLVAVASQHAHAPSTTPSKCTCLPFSPAHMLRPMACRTDALTAGAEGVPPVLSDRSLPAAAAAAAAGASPATGVAEAAAELPASMSQLGGPPYRYVVFHIWFVTITKRSLNLALALSGLTFAALQSASLCLVTTPPEAMARAVGRALRPLGLLGLPVKELVLTTLLALRFMATVREGWCAMLVAAAEGVVPCSGKCKPRFPQGCSWSRMNGCTCLPQQKVVLPPGWCPAAAEQQVASRAASWFLRFLSPRRPHTCAEEPACMSIAKSSYSRLPLRLGHPAGFRGSSEPLLGPGIAWHRLAAAGPARHRGHLRGHRLEAVFQLDGAVRQHCSSYVGAWLPGSKRA